MRLLAGALLDRPPGPKYVAELGFAELSPSDPLPKPRTLAKWRQGLPTGFELALRAPAACWRSSAGPLRLDDELDVGLGWLAQASEALQPTLIVVATDASVTTGARDRERLRAYFDRIPRPNGALIAWKPRGLWEPAATQSMASTLSVIGGFDALDDPVPSQDVVYACLLAEGLRRSFSHSQLLQVVEKLQSSTATRAFVTVESAQSFREARLLQALFEGGE